MSAGPVRVAVTGGRGRLGSAVLRALEDVPGWTPVAWSRPAYDLDDPSSAARCLDRDRPAIVVHCAAWTDVDGCARYPDLAMRRNADAARSLARACAGSGARLALVSTNEVFDGERSDGRGYREDDPVAPRNPYGRSKLAGEEAVLGALRGGRAPWIVRTAWLHGPPGNDFPTKIVAAADRLPVGEALPVVADEFGSPTWTADLAAAIRDLLRATDGGTFHLVNSGAASRLEWAAHVLSRLRPRRRVRPISRGAFERASVPPAWGVLDGSRAASTGVVLRDWREAMDAALAEPGRPEGSPQG